MTEVIRRKGKSPAEGWKDRLYRVLVEAGIVEPGQSCQLAINLHESGIGDLERKERFK
jgi:hypothetical protein